MNLTPIKANMTELEIKGVRVLFSYRTPVALVDTHGIGYATEKFWSQTTKRHINTWFKDMNYAEGKADTAVRAMPQHWFDEFVAGVK